MYKEKLYTLKETANFLKVPKYNDKTKRSLSHLIICKIQKLLPDNCNICNVRYKIGLLELPILECAVCGQGVHKPCWLNLATNNTNIDEDTDAELFRSLHNPLNLPGMFYVCHACQPNTIPNDSDGDNKRKKKKVSKDAALSSQGRPEELPETQTEDVVLLTQDANDKESNTKETKYQNQNQNQHEDSGSNIRICRFYKNGNCKYGLKGKECKFTHPKMCRKYTQHGTNKQRGCNLGKKCKDFHPKMCFDSIRKGECLVASCRFTHVKGTRREPIMIKNIVNHNNKPLAEKDEKIKSSEPDLFVQCFHNFFLHQTDCL